MAAPVQIGDIVTLSKVAWDVYQLGWSDDLNAEKQYREFFQDVKLLHHHLQILDQVVASAHTSLRTQGASSSIPVRWDPGSLREIVGDFEATLWECFDLIQENQRFGLGRTGAAKNIEWNIMLQPTANRLRSRITMHTAKVLFILKPFEIDLLSRVQQDLRRMHEDLANRITAVHLDLRRFMTVVVPDLAQALDQQQNHCYFFLEIPPDVADQFRASAASDPSRLDDAGRAYRLQELGDALVGHFDRSTRDFVPGMVVAERIPSVESYLSLLKCVWILERMREAPGVKDAEATSHWPSYVNHLEETVSEECHRFQYELIQPDMSEISSQKVFSIWPGKEQIQLVPVVTRDEMLEQVLEVPLQAGQSHVTSTAKLYRRLGSDGKRFRVAITGTDQSSSHPRHQTEIINFNLSESIINPQYALPTSLAPVPEFILSGDERIARLAFTNMKDVLKFQQAVTGFWAYNAYSAYNVTVSFVFEGAEQPVLEKACIQLWIPKQVDGSLVRNRDVAKGNEPGRKESMRTDATSPTAMSGAIPITGRSSHGQSITRSPEMATASPDFASSPTIGRQWSQPPPPLSTSPMSRQWSQPQPLGYQPYAQSPRSPPPGMSLPVHMSPPRGGGHSPVFSPAQPYRANSIWSTPTRVSTLYPPSSATRTDTFAHTHASTNRTFSVSSTAPTVLSSSSSSSSVAHTAPIDIGTAFPGVLHRKPANPLLVLFTQSTKNPSQLSVVTVQIDRDTNVNPERCHCRKAGPEGRGCRIVAIEQEKGDRNLVARRWEAGNTSNKPQRGGGGGGASEWNIAPLADTITSASSPSLQGSAVPRGDKSESSWSGLKRLSIMFHSPEDRAKFGGAPCKCRNIYESDLKECLYQGHRGLWGEVQEWYRGRYNAWYKGRHEGHKQVVYGQVG